MEENKKPVTEAEDSGINTDDSPVAADAAVNGPAEAETAGETLADKTAEPESAADRPKKKRKRTFASGFLLGALITLLAVFAGAVLYRGYLAFPAEDGGTITIKFPYYNALHGKDDGRLDKVEITRKMDEIEDLIDETYLYDIDEQFMSDAIFAGMVYGLDEDNYAAYYTKRGYKEERERNVGSYVGIGITAMSDPEGRGVLVADIAENGPAVEAGLKIGDIIIEADGQSMAGLDLAESVDHIGGQEGTEVELTVLRENQDENETSSRAADDSGVPGFETLYFTVTRQKVTQVDIRAKVLPGTDIGYISITGFTLESEYDFSIVLDDLVENEEVEGLIFDLRNNPGGDMNSCLDMLDLLVPDGSLLLSVEDKDGNAAEYKSSDEYEVDLPMVALVNKDSASASEIFAGVLQSYGYDVVGEKTFGKGIVQTMVGLSDGSAVSFTTHRYRLPNGDLIHGKGIEPTVPAEFHEYNGITQEMVNYADSGRYVTDGDPQIEAAVEALNIQE